MRGTARRWVVGVAWIATLLGANAVCLADEPTLPDSASGSSYEDTAGKAAAIDARGATALMHEAERELRQAALQRDVASRSNERALLRQARADLERAARGVSGAQRERVMQVLADLDAAMRRGSTQLGPFISALPDTDEPPLPGRNELAVLAKQGLALLNDQPQVRPPDTDDVAWTHRSATPATTGTDRSGTPLTARDVMSPVSGETVAWSQLQQFPFGGFR